MRIELEKGLIAKTANFFFEMNLKGKQSRHRTKFVKLLQKHFKEFSEDEKNLLEEHAERDESGEIKRGEQPGSYVIENKEAFMKDKIELFSEKIVFDAGEHEEMLKTIARILEEYDGELNGADAELYDVLATEFEESA